MNFYVFHAIVFQQIFKKVLILFFPVAVSYIELSVSSHITTIKYIASTSLLLLSLTSFRQTATSQIDERYVNTKRSSVNI